jgi:hypothetical protein
MYLTVNKNIQPLQLLKNEPGDANVSLLVRHRRIRVDGKLWQLVEDSHGHLGLDLFNENQGAHQSLSLELARAVSVNANNQCVFLRTRSRAVGTGATMSERQ